MDTARTTITALALALAVPAAVASQGTFDVDGHGGGTFPAGDFGDRAGAGDQTDAGSATG